MICHPENTILQIVQKMTFEKDKVVEFCIGVTGIYGLYSLAGLLQEIIMKMTYEHDDTGHQETFDYPESQIIFVGIVTYLIGTLYNFTQYPSQVRNNIPWFHGLKCGAAVTSSTITYSYAIYLTNFPVVMMIRSCGILSVVLVGVLFTGVEDTALKLGKKKIFIAVIATVGIIIFKAFDPNDAKNSKETAVLGIVLMIVSLLADGFLPDFQAIIKQRYQPPATVLMAEVNKWAAILALTFSIATGHFIPMMGFVFAHTALLVDLLAIGALCAFGQMFIYRIVKKFKQHIVPFIITTRKIFTVALSIFYFGHEISPMQTVGLLIVLGISIFEFLSEMKTSDPTTSKTE